MSTHAPRGLAGSSRAFVYNPPFASTVAGFDAARIAMNKFIKKNQKWIMVGGGTLLMVAWLLPDGLSRMSNPERRVEATMDGRKVRGKEWDTATFQYRAINTLVERTFIPGQPPVITPLAQFGCESSEHFFLLSELAQRQGLIGGKADADEIFERTLDVLAAKIAMRDMDSGGAASTRAMDFMMSFQSPVGVAPEELAKRETARQLYFDAARTQSLPALREEIMRASGLREDQMEQALAVYRGIVRMYENYIGTARMSDRRVIATARRFGESSGVDYVLVGAERLASRVPDPTPEEVVAHYEKYKNVASGTGEFGIGYRKPDRVKLEWVEINKAKVASVIKLLPAHVRERWDRQNPGGTTAAFNEKRADFEQSLRNEYAEEIIKLADIRFRELAGEATRALAADGKYRALPANWRETSLPMDKLAAELAAAVKSETSTPDDYERWQSPVEIETPIVNPETAWLDVAAVRALSGVGAAAIADGSRSISFDTLVMSVRELPGGTSTLPVQVGVIPVFDRTVSDRTGNHYYFRITAARPAGEPESLDEVRAQVVTDIKRLRAFELLKEEIEKAGAASLTGGLEAATSVFNLADSATVSVTQFAPVEIQRNLLVSTDSIRSGGFSGADLTPLDVPAFREAVAAKASALDARATISSLPTPDRTVWMPLPGSLSAVVARIERVSPVTVERVRMLDTNILNTARQNELGRFDDWISRSPFTLEALKSSLSFKRAGDKEAAGG
jgi:hypothetical protein